MEWKPFLFLSAQKWNKTARLSDEEVKVAKYKLDFAFASWEPYDQHEILPFDGVISVMPRIAFLCKGRQDRRESIFVHLTPIQVLCNVMEGGVRGRV